MKLMIENTLLHCTHLSGVDIKNLYLTVSGKYDVMYLSKLIRPHTVYSMSLCIEDGRTLSFNGVISITDISGDKCTFSVAVDDGNFSFRPPAPQVLVGNKCTWSNSESGGFKSRCGHTFHNGDGTIDWMNYCTVLRR